jgi:hypothetical protein
MDRLLSWERSGWHIHSGEYQQFKRTPKARKIVEVPVSLCGVLCATWNEPVEPETIPLCKQCEQQQQQLLVVKDSNNAR